MVSDVDKCFEQPCDVYFSRFGKVGEEADAGNVFAPAGHRFINGLECFVDLAVARDVVKGVTTLVFVGYTDLEIALPLARVGEGIELVEHEVLIAAVAQGIAFFHGVIPADHALATSRRAEFDLTK